MRDVKKNQLFAFRDEFSSRNEPCSSTRPPGLAQGLHSPWRIAMISTLLSFSTAKEAPPKTRGRRHSESRRCRRIVSESTTTSPAPPPPASPPSASALSLRSARAPSTIPFLLLLLPHLASACKLCGRDRKDRKLGRHSPSPCRRLRPLRLRPLLLPPRSLFPPSSSEHRSPLAGPWTAISPAAAGA